MLCRNFEKKCYFEEILNDNYILGSFGPIEIYCLLPNYK
jgi:hypothetical protein